MKQGEFWIEDFCKFSDVREGKRDKLNNEKAFPTIEHNFKIARTLQSTSLKLIDDPTRIREIS